MVRTFVIATAALALLLSACTGTPSAPQATPAPQATQASVSVAVPAAVANQNAPVPSKSTGSSVNAPASLPVGLKDFRVPSGFSLETAGTIAAGGSQMDTGTWRGKAKVADVSAFYKQYATEQGWEIATTIENNDSGQVYATGKDGLSYIVSYTERNNEEVDLSVMAGKEAQATPPTGSQAIAPSVPKVTTLAEKPQAQPAPVSPALADVSEIPNELKDVPIPSGFGVVKDSAFRMTVGTGVTATVSLSGQGEIENIKDFYVQAFKARGLQEQVVMSTADETTVIYGGMKDGKQSILSAGIEKTDTGIGVTINYTSS